MLFMGTKKYPDEAEYSEYISKAGGYDNAYTSLTNTNYHFECSNEAFEGAVDRFSQFFIDPLLGDSQSEREMKAVDSEYNMGKQNDSRRNYVLKRELTHKNSSVNRFTTGNLETLQRPGVRQAMLNFYEKWYSSNIMKLVISSNLSLEKQEEMVMSKFSAVVNKNVSVPDYKLPLLPWTAENLGQYVRQVPV
jgi:insulysin